MAKSEHRAQQPVEDGSGRRAVASAWHSVIRGTTAPASPCEQKRGEKADMPEISAPYAGDEKDQRKESGIREGVPTQLKNSQADVDIFKFAYICRIYVSCRLRRADKKKNGVTKEK
ncbi:hypothetical protein FOCC_FOCC002883 [Frankliniella occidentalis]|nr:hypothetical protein FOCC_FOCC002883 [Frankliniella occidentalis]